DELGLIVWACQFLLQELGCIHFGVKLGLEIEAGRMAKKAMGRSGVAVATPVLAAPVGIDRAIKAEVWAVVESDDAFCGLPVHLGVEGRILVIPRPAVVDRLPQLPFKAADLV